MLRPAFAMQYSPRLMLATVAGRKAYASGQYAFLWASSETGERGAGLLELLSVGGR